ncbi:MAG TPA: hypothetical protein VHA13_01955, partial [Gammaproteobacteria bacterium]|nr:hypothetical protein [Gammaproteobacteria bacterium]
DDKEGPDVFVIFYHCQGLSDGELADVAEEKEEKDTVINNFCKKAINDMFCDLSNRFDDEEVILSKIIITESSLIRCLQSNPENIQEEVAAKFKSILSSTDEINELIEEDGSIEAEIEFENYNFKLLEELEQYENNDKAHGEADSIHVFGNFSGGELKLIYYKGFETVNKLLEAKAEEKNEARTAQPASSASLSNNSNQGLSQSTQVANTASIGMSLFGSQAIDALRSTTSTLNSSPQTVDNTQANPSSSSNQTNNVVQPNTEHGNEQIENKKPGLGSGL